MHSQQFDNHPLKPHGRRDLEKTATVASEIKFRVKTDSSRDKSVEYGFHVVFQRKEKGKPAERVDTGAEVIKTLVQGRVEDRACLREGINGWEIGYELRL
jgi:hypothetical protein